MKRTKRTVVLAYLKYTMGLLITAGLISHATAHTYFFGVSELTHNSDNNKIEIIHQFTAHDIENAIAQEKQVHFSPEHPKYEHYIQAYFEKRFKLEQNQTPVTLNWVGFEVSVGKIIAYQESKQQTFLPQLVVKNTILVDTYPQQVNTVNFQSTSLQGSLTFNHAVKISKISAKSETIPNNSH